MPRSDIWRVGSQGPVVVHLHNTASVTIATFPGTSVDPVRLRVVENERRLDLNAHPSAVTDRARALYVRRSVAFGIGQLQPVLVPQSRHV